MGPRRIVPQTRNGQREAVERPKCQPSLSRTCLTYQNVTLGVKPAVGPCPAPEGSYSGSSQHKPMLASEQAQDHPAITSQMSATAHAMRSNAHDGFLYGPASAVPSGLAGLQPSPVDYDPDFQNLLAELGAEGAPQAEQLLDSSHIIPATCTPSLICEGSQPSSGRGAVEHLPAIGSQPQLQPSPVDHDPDFQNLLAELGAEGAPQAEQLLDSSYVIPATCEGVQPSCGAVDHLPATVSPTHAMTELPTPSARQSGLLPGNVDSTPGKGVTAWTLKNRRAQRRFKAKERVLLHREDVIWKLCWKMS